MKIECPCHDPKVWECWRDDDGYVYHMKKVMTHEELMDLPRRDAIFRLNRASDRVNDILNKKG